MARLLLVYQTKPDIVFGLGRCFKNHGDDVFYFLADQHHHWIDKYIFHVINKWAHNLRFLKKNKFFFEGHKLNHWNYLNDKLVASYKKTKPDVVIFIHGINYSDHTLTQITCPKVGWLVDPVTNPERLSLFASKLDWYYSYSYKTINTLKQLGFIKTGYLSHAVDHLEFYPIPNHKKLIDISFVGKHSDHREKFILAALEVTKNVSVYGSRWITRAFFHPSLFFAIKGSRCYGNRLNTLYNSSRIVLSIIAKPQSTDGIESGINMRPYEVLASGALLFSDQYEELHPELINQDNLILFNSVEEFKGLLSTLLNNHAEIDRIAINGRKFIKNRFSYTAMVDAIFVQLEKFSLPKLR